MSARKLSYYPDYADSEVEWIGRSPANWIITRNKDIFQERGSLSKSGEETLLTVSHITGVTRRTEKNVNMFMAETMEGYKHCKAGDMVINTMWAWMGALGAAKEDGICSPAYGVYAPKKGVPYHPAYFDYLYRTPNAVSEMTRNSKGIVSSRLRLYPKDFFQIRTALPAYKEQVVIANYLDIKTTLIDKKIDLLSQKLNHYKKFNQALINETVTRGLDKNVIFKDSECEWVDKIPVKWSLKRVEDVALVIDPQPDHRAPAIVHEGGFPYIGIRDVNNNGSLNFKTARKVSLLSIEKQEKAFQVRPGDIVFCKVGTLGIPRLIIPEGRFALSATLVLIKSKKKSSNTFLKYALESTCVVNQINHYGSGSTRPALGIKQIRKFVFASPPPLEQLAITTYLDEQTKRIDKIVTCINQQVKLLRELRKTLINDVVTGKLKVTPEDLAA